MRVVIIHYHLNHGGVTRIIYSQIVSLLKKFSPDEILLVTGDVPKDDDFKKLEVQITVNPLLNYLVDSKSTQELSSMYNQILIFLKNILQEKDIVHCHNLNLGKNPVLSLALHQLAKENFRIVSHCHDFPEDRPLNLAFLSEIIEKKFKKEVEKVLYPTLPNFLFAVLNSFDMKRLQQYGVTKENIFLLPNPVSFESSFNKNEARDKIFDLLQIDKNKKLVTYPVRAIKRKNLGEFILLAVLFSNEATWNVTLPPENPVEIKEYKGWKDFCSEQKIEIIFETGLKTNFRELIAASDFCITTSVREGFGMVFLEPWLLETPVKGRDISYVTDEFKNKGVMFQGFYSTLNVQTKNEVIDFKDMSIKEQKEFIIQIKNDKESVQKVFTLNPFLKNFIKPVSTELILKNEIRIKEKFSIERYAERLEGIYNRFA